MFDFFSADTDGRISQGLTARLTVVDAAGWVVSSPSMPPESFRLLNSDLGPPAVKPGDAVSVSFDGLRRAEDVAAAFTCLAALAERLEPAADRPAPVLVSAAASVAVLSHDQYGFRPAPASATVLVGVAHAGGYAAASGPAGQAHNPNSGLYALRGLEAGHVDVVMLGVRAGDVAAARRILDAAAELLAAGKEASS